MAQHTAHIGIAGAAIVSFGVASVLAQHGGDILLDITPKGAIRTNLLEASGHVEPGVRVFAAEFGEVFPDFTDEPGFDSLPGAFPVPSSNRFVVRRALRKWDNANFDAIPDERIDIAFASLGPVSTPPSDVVVEGFSLPVGSNGQWHRHLEYTLTPPASPGVYLLELELRSSAPGIEPSLAFWLVFDQNAGETEHDAALEWVERHLADPCRADFNADQEVNSQDFFDFLGAFFAGDADFNADGATNTQDFFDFLGLFFLGC